MVEYEGQGPSGSLTYIVTNAGFMWMVQCEAPATGELCQNVYAMESSVIRTKDLKKSIFRKHWCSIEQEIGSQL